ncbi:hypothetical protein F5Y05DRAFT_396962 [Hypoxylon sp. FL0543]|nr:hypothetical protein F5Y05DRAFT_396962 [Hypoxylon sp. FL0543]
MDTSPSKRRVLAPIDANSSSPAAVLKLEACKVQHLNQVNSSSMKRSLDSEPVRQGPQCQLVQPAKKQRTSVDGFTQSVVEDGGHSLGRDSHRSQDGNSCDHDSDADRQPSEPPDEDSSIFDNSAIDTSQATTITEPDADVAALAAPVPPRRQRAMTLEEARIKVETLRLRLSLANYKVRTGQTDLPLDQLKIKPLPGSSKPGRDRRARQPSLPPMPQVISSRSGEGSEPQSRPTTATRKALPSAPPFRRGDSFDHRPGGSPSGRRSLPELAAASLSTIRASQAVSPKSR